MFKYTLRLFFVASACLFYAFSIVQRTNNNPPGTFYAKQLGYWVDSKEISVGDWQEFYDYIKNKFGVDSAAVFLPDTGLIVSHFKLKSFNSLRLKEKYQMPLIGVTLAQVWHYCRFRTEAVNLKYHTNYEYLLLDLETFTAISDNRKKYKNLTWVGANIPEVIILSDKSIKIVNGNQTEENQEVRGVFGFRCIAKLR